MVTPVGIEPRTSHIGVRRSTTTPPRSLNWCMHSGKSTCDIPIIFVGNLMQGFIHSFMTGNFKTQTIKGF